jgi:hypothetical protein
VLVPGLVVGMAAESAVETAAGMVPRLARLTAPDLAVCLDVQMELDLEGGLGIHFPKDLMTAGLMVPSWVHHW